MLMSFLSMSVGLLIAVATVAISTNLLLNEDEKQELLGVWRRALEKISGSRTGA
jgi:hypothetical protein